jgi:hypothetical protein
MTLQSGSIDYGLRKLRVVYTVASVALLVGSSIAFALYNSRHMCGIKVGKGGVYDICTTASNLGHGLSPVLLVVEAIALIAGFFLLPRIHYYLTPPTFESENPNVRRFPENRD